MRSKLTRSTAPCAAASARCPSSARVGAAEEGEAGVVEALQAEADAVDAGAGEVGEARGLGAVGIGLERDLDVVGGAPMVARGGDDRFDRRGRHQRRRAAAEEDRGQAVVGEEGGFMRQVGEQGVAPRVLVDACRGRGC